MTALKNIKGQRFGKLIVLERAENRIRESGRQDVVWKSFVLKKHCLNRLKMNWLKIC